MEKFIRLDLKGQWRGTEHVSSMQGLGEETYFEDGISCYSLDSQAYALENLRYYWFDLAGVTESDLENMQVTIFEGESIGQGSDWEDISTCSKTLKEFDAKDFMIKIQNTYLDKEDDEEYEERLNEMELF